MNTSATVRGLTEQQHRAVTTRQVSVVLSSGAGCGKTHVLTERYLAHLREGVSVAEVVAITFTEKAARQMRERIRAAVIRNLRTAETDDLSDHWAEQLRNLELAPISTIHAFCANLLRQYAVEAGLDPGFEILDEMLAQGLREQSLTECLQRLLLEESLAATHLHELIRRYGWNVTEAAISRLVRQHDSVTWSGWLNRTPEQIARYWLDLARDELQPRYLQLWLRRHPFIGQMLRLLERHPPLPGPMTDQVNLLLKEIPCLPQSKDLAAVKQRLFDAAKVGRVGAKAWPDKAVYEQIRDSFDRFRDSLKGLTGLVVDDEPEQLLMAADVGQRFLQVAREAVSSWQNTRRRHSVVSFDDLLVGARDLLRDHPEVRQQLQQQFRYLLIDELQDTDPVQMELVELLAGEGLTQGKLFAVGDHKQAIYRFRGAEVALFQGLRHRLPEPGQQSLSLNFRSQPGILEFVNALFGQALPDYEPLVAYQSQRNPAACVEFLWSSRSDKQNAQQARKTEAECLARRLVHLLEQPLVADQHGDGLRTVRPGDIAVLFRAMTNVHIYESALRDVGLDYYLVGGRAFYAQQEILDVLNLLRAIDNPLNGVSLAGALRSPFFCISDEGLFALCQPRTGLWNALFDEHSRQFLTQADRPRVERAARLLAGWRDCKDRLCVAALLQRILEESAYDAAIRLEFLGERKLANLWKLIDLARRFDQTGRFGLAEFIQRLNDLTTSQPLEEQAATQPENADVIRLMSIHQAKGLEFPVVVIPDLAAEQRKSSYPVAHWSSLLGCVVQPSKVGGDPEFSAFAWNLFTQLEALEQWDEDLRTLYVACTRPADYLILSAALPDNYQPNGPWMLTLAERFDLRTGECRADLPLGQPVPRIHVYNPDDYPFSPTPVTTTVDTSTTPPPVPVIPVVVGRATLSMEQIDRALQPRDWLYAEISAADEPPLERSLRAIIQRWPFAEVNGWEPLLQVQHLAAPEHAILERILRSFAASSLYQRLSASQQLYRKLDFVMRLDASATSPTISGTIDCLWQEPDGRWCLLEWITHPVAAGTESSLWRERSHRLALAATAVSHQIGKPPTGIGLACLHEATFLERKRFSIKTELDRVRTAITQIPSTR
jgi:ATP-dependent helicase/nuclease subunit A